MNEDGQNKKHFDISLKIRNFEIDLFWKRSLFFWGFISAAFLAYAALRQSELRIVVACFGMVCSCAWTLVNRGSKYWQESWEIKVERFELLGGVLFGKTEDPQYDRGCWLRGRKYSVSKLAIALSDYVFLLWVVLVMGDALRPLSLYIPFNMQPSCLKVWLMETFVILSVLYVVLLFVFGRQTRRRITLSQT
jgi:hypothetical protein